MKYRIWLTTILCAASLAACNHTGDFADLYTPVCFDDADLAREVVMRDRRAAEAIATNNALVGGEAC